VRDPHVVLVDPALDRGTIRVLVVEPAEVGLVDVARVRQLGGQESGVALVVARAVRRAPEYLRNCGRRTETTARPIPDPA